MTKSGAIDIRISRDEAERLRFWAGRKAAFPAAGRISPDYYCMDGTIPRKNLASILSGIEALSAKYGLRCMNVFHAGDGNLHPLILYDANRPGELELTEEFGARILQMCIEAGGTITGEHGVGVEKINQMCAQFKPAGAGNVPCGKSGIRSFRLAESRESRTHAPPLRGAWRDARASGKRKIP